MKKYENLKSYGNIKSMRHYTSPFLPRHGPAGDETGLLLEVLRGEFRGPCGEESWGVWV
jgi:hypothetical protein